jgi:hypothetical protein
VFEKISEREFAFKVRRDFYWNHILIIHRSLFSVAPVEIKRTNKKQNRINYEMGLRGLELSKQCFFRS